MVFSAPVLLYAAAVVLIAAAVRGFSGFGFSLLAVPALSLFIPPVDAVPVLLLLEVVASIHMLPGIWRSVDWRAIALLMLGCLAGAPFGAYMLAHMPAAPLQLFLAVAVGLTALLLLRGSRLTHAPGKGATIATGGLSGLLNGALGIGGPPVILFFFSSPAAAHLARASIVAYFLLLDVYSLAMAGVQGLVGRATLMRASIFLPILVFGVWLGDRGFRHVSQERFRQAVLWILLGLSLLSGAKALYSL